MPLQKAPKSLVILTASFPFMPGEQFLENEIPYWESTKFSSVTVLPLTANGKPRQTPGTIAIDTSLARQNRRMAFLIRALVSSYYLTELLHLRKSRKLSPRTATRALRSTARLLQLEYALTHSLQNKNSFVVAYTFWNDIQAYAACLAKRKGLIQRVVSRAHGFDVYDERRPSQYMPLKRQFIHDFDNVFVLSSEAQQYMIDRYGFSPNKIDISPLGVILPATVANPTVPHNLHVVSVSFCVPVKRIDKIIASLRLFASQNPKLTIQWTHIGDGPLKADITAQAEQDLSPFKNLTFHIKGHLKNSEVKAHYSTVPVDVFLNLSESEGIPISIMEAMAAGVPAIAPNIGGISELISPDSGILLSPNATLDETVLALSTMTVRAKLLEVREAARRLVAQRFNAEYNYPDFTRKIERISNL